MPRDPEESQSSVLAKYLQYSYVGLQFFLSIAIFTGGGIWLDRWLGTVVLFTLLGLALGFAGGLYSLYREVFQGRNSTTEGSSRKSSNDNASPNPDDSSQK